MRITLLRDHPAEGWPSMDRYAEQLAAALRPLLPEGWTLSMPMPPPPLAGRYGSLVSRVLVYPRWARRQQGDITHLLDHSYGTVLSGLDPARALVTVHDIAPLRIPGRRLGLSGLVFQLAWRNVRKARRIIADSAFTASELQRQGIPAARLRVVHLGISPHLRPLPLRREALLERYLPTRHRMLLHVGHTQARKNFPLLLQALALLRRDGLPVALIQIGGRPDEAQHQLIDDLHITAAVRFLGKVDEATLATFYSACDVFVFPSLYEGFGLPVLEAMACGAPVVIADASSLPEIAGEASLRCNPHQPESLAAAIRHVLESPTLAAELRQRGQNRARHFSWQQTAQNMLDIYRGCYAAQ